MYIVSFPLARRDIPPPAMALGRMWGSVTKKKKKKKKNDSDVQPTHMYHLN